MTILALVPGATVWLAIAACWVVWLPTVLLSRGRLPGPRRIAHWLLSAWLPRLATLAFWGVAGWHVFCQRP